MQALDYWKTVTADRVDFLDRVIDTLSTSGVKYCVVGGQAVNADLADISRLLEAYPELRPRVPADILARLL